MLNYSFLSRLNELPVDPKIGMFFIMDSDVFIYKILNDEISNKINIFLKEFKDKSDEFKHFARPSISQVSILEILKTVPEKEIDSYFKKINDVTTFPVNKEVLFLASRISNYYVNKGIDIKGIDLADLIISATAFMLGALIITTNQKHYPSIFFREAMTKIVYWKDKNERTKTLLLYCLIVKYRELNNKFCIIQNKI